jgi:hypothetical protein
MSANLNSHRKLSSTEMEYQTVGSSVRLSAFTSRLYLDVFALKLILGTLK